MKSCVRQTLSLDTTRGAALPPPHEPRLRSAPLQSWRLRRARDPRRGVLAVAGREELDRRSGGSRQLGSWLLLAWLSRHGAMAPCLAARRGRLPHANADHHAVAVVPHQSFERTQGPTVPTGVNLYSSL